MEFRVKEFKFLPAAGYMNDVIAIEESCEIDAGRWTSADFCQFWGQIGSILLVAETEVGPNTSFPPVHTKVGPMVVGYLAAEYGDQGVGIMRIGVPGEYRRQGVGADLVWTLCQRPQTQKRKFVLALLRETNDGAIGFFRSQGFFANCLVRGMYDDTGEDAIRMLLEVGTGRRASQGKNRVMRFFK